MKETNDEELHNLHSSPSVLRRQNKGGSYGQNIGNHAGNVKGIQNFSRHILPLGRLKSRWENIIKNRILNKQGVEM